MLQRDRRQPPPDDFREQLAELLGYIKDGDPAPYLLGSSPQSAVWAAELGLPYVFADFINPAGEPYAAFYREHFTASSRLREPHVSVCAWAVCAETREEAVRLSASARMMMLLLFRGRLIAVPPVEEALEFLKHEAAPMETLPVHRRVIAGDPDAVRGALETLARDYGADEVFVVNILYDHAARLRSYELLGRAFALAAV